MHDIRFIRENPNTFDENLNKRGVTSCSKEILKLDNEKRKLQTLIQEKQKLRNDVSKKIAEIKSKGESADTFFSEVSDVKKEILELEINENELTAQLNKYLLELPNLIDSDLPIGGEENNKLLRKWGKIKRNIWCPSF